MTAEFEGLVVIITGGASGIGPAGVQRFLDGGARVGVLDVNIDGANPDALAVTADVADDASVRAIEAVVNELTA